MHGQAAGHGNDLTGDEPGVIRCQEADDPGVVFGLAQSFHRNGAFQTFGDLYAGFAFGMDRLVAILAGEDNIREVIAFPKTQSGADPLTGAPTAIDDRHLEELGLRVLPPKQ